jgi:hypothetical protein
MSRYPGRLRMKGPSPTEFHYRADYFAVRQTGKRAAAGAVTTMADSAQTQFAVFHGTPDERADAEPVYSAGRDGPLAVPTGRIFVRLADGLTPEERRDEFESLGLRIEKTLSYAPNAAWLCPAHGGAAEALQLLSEVEKVPGVVHCEPQMLLQRTTRKG